MRAAAVDPIETWATQAHDLALSKPDVYARRIVRQALLGAAILHSVTAFGLLGAVVLTAMAWALSTPAFLIPAGASLALGVFWFFHLIRPIDISFGVPLDVKTAPALFALLEKVAKQVGAPMPTRVELVPEFNAWVQVSRRPRGEWRIALGLPLMLATELPDFTAVVGHELGHFVAGTFGARVVWAQQAGWRNTFQLLSSSSLFAVVRGWFRDWGQRFSAEAVAMARRHEYSADKTGASVAGAPAAATGLIRMTLLERAMSDRFWPQMWNRISEGDSPPDDVFVDLRHFLASLEQADVDRYFRSAVQEQTLAFDVHPSLSDRLAHLGQRAMLPARIGRSAAAELFGAKLDEVSLLLGRAWMYRVKPEWAEAVEEAKTLKKLLAEHGNRPVDTVHPNEALELARALRLAGRLSEAMPYYRRAAEVNRDYWKARLAWGLAQLEMGDARGLADLSVGVSLSQGSHEAIIRAFVGARKFLEARGEPQKNPFTAVVHKLRLNEGRNRALHDWGRPAAW